MATRLGDLLIDAGLLSNEQVAQGLRAQVMWGGRLGTNLIELGYLDLDELSRLLGRQQRYPAALAWHFEQADSVLQQQLSPELAERYTCLPIARVGEKVIVATAAPIDARGLKAIATALATESAHLMPALAAELRVRYYLERVYRLPRATRYLRTRSACQLPFETALQGERKRLGALSEDRQLPLPEPKPVPGPRRERRYVQTLGMPHAELEPPTRYPRGTTSSMKARRALPNLGLSLASATRSIRAAADREQVADLVVATLAGFVPTCQAAMLLVVRGNVAMAVTGFRRDGVVLPDVAVSLDEPGLVPSVIRNTRAMREKAANLGPVDTALLEALGGSGDLVIEPMQIVGHVMGVLVMAVRPNEGLVSVISIAMATGAAFSRLMRDAAR